MSSYKVQVNEDYSWPEPFDTAPITIHESVIDEMDPEYVAFFNKVLINRPDILETHKYPVAVTKAGGNTMPGQAPPVEMSEIYDFRIPRKYTEGPEIPARVFIPKGEKPSSGWPCMIWFHGGGWVLGSIGTETSFCTIVADTAKCLVMTIDYRLAPEDPFPAALHDAFDTTMYVMNNATTLEVDNKRVGLFGSSAGGNLTAVMAHKYAHSPLTKNLPPLKLQLMIVPVIDNTATGDTYPSWKRFQFTPQLSAAKMSWYRQLYLPEGGDSLKDPEASPIFYPDDSFKGLPRAFIASAGCDVLRSEAEAYHEKLVKNGVSSKIKIYAGVPHPVMAMNDILSKGIQLVNDACEEVKDALK